MSQRDSLIEKEINDLQNLLEEEIIDEESPIEEEIIDKESPIEEEINDKESPIEEEINDKESPIEGEINDLQNLIEEEINDLQNLIDEEIIDKESPIEEEINDKQSPIEEEINDEQNLIEEEINDKESLIEEETNDEQNLIEEEINDEENSFESDLGISFGRLIDESYNRNLCLFLWSLSCIIQSVVNIILNSTELSDPQYRLGLLLASIVLLVVQGSNCSYSFICSRPKLQMCRRTSGLPDDVNKLTRSIDRQLNNYFYVTLINLISLIYGGLFLYLGLSNNNRGFTIVQSVFLAPVAILALISIFQVNSFSKRLSKIVYHHNARRGSFEDNEDRDDRSVGESETEQTNDNPIEDTAV